MEMENRKSYIDFLKVIGLLGIIAAHVKSPDWIMMLRSFDVPLMVLLSGILAKKSINNREQKMGGYLLKRSCRLVIPTWIFLAVYFVLFAIVDRTYDLSYYLYSFLFTRYGIGYVWIVLIYLYCAVMAPFINKVKLSTKNIIIIFLIFCLYCLAFRLGIGTDNKIVMSTIYFIIPYGIVTVLGMNYESFSQKTKIIIITISGVLFIAYMCYYWIQTGSFQLVQIEKYPPRIYYLSYGICISFILLILCEKKNYRLFRSKLVVFISSHSFWIYLWHILCVTLITHFIDSKYWFVQYIFIICMAVSIVWIQNKVLDGIEDKYGHDIKYFKYLRY